MSDNEIYLLIKYIKTVLCRVAKRLSHVEDARCLKVKPLVFVARHPQVIRSVDIATDLYRVPIGSNLMMTNRESADVLIIWSLEIDILIRGFGFSGKAIVNSICLARAGELDYIFRHFNIISLKSFRSRAANSVSDHL